MTIEEIIKIENEYEPPTVRGYYETCDVLNFLAERHITIQNKNLTNELKQEMSKWNLTKFEMLMVLCMYGNIHYAFRHKNYKTLVTPLKEMCSAMDTLLRKLPSYSGRLLRRYCTNDDITEMNAGQIITFPYYVNTTFSNWKIKSDIYLISPLKDNSKGKCMYLARNKTKENQVTFQRNTSFLVTSVEHNKYNKIFHLKELAK